MFERNIYYSEINIDEEFKKENLLSIEEKIKLYKRNFGSAKYNFPREKVAKVKLYKNRFLLSCLTSKTVSESSKSEVLFFLNNPVNFDWGETTWEVAESEYILRFYNKEDHEIGKIWLCIEGCGMTKSIPFSPNMKYGGLSEIGKQRLEKILNKILTE